MAEINTYLGMCGDMHLECVCIVIGLSDFVCLHRDHNYTVCSAETIVIDIQPGKRVWLIVMMPFVLKNL